MSLPLDGIRVVEIATFVAVPSAGALLADLGAEVIKVEVPQGETYRNSRPRMAGFKVEFDASPQYEMSNRGKKSLVLDLTRPEALEALRRVIDRCDIVLTNMLPGRCERFGLDAATLRPERPALIYAALNGYGRGGEEADKPAFDYAAYWARTGMMDLIRHPDAAPTFQRPGVGDHAAGLSLVCGILAALRTRDKTGEGQEIDVSLLQIGMYVQGNDLSQVLVAGHSPPLHDRAKPANPLWNFYPTADERWIVVVMIESDRYWPILCEALERPDLLADERFDGPVPRFRNSQALVEILDEVFRSRTLSEWEVILTQHRVIWSPVREMHEILDDPQVKAMGYLETVDHPRVGRFSTVGAPLSMSAHRLSSNRPAPELGADSEDVLRESGLTAQEIAKLLP
ncbi:MAG: CoA transferase [bacterium]|nr:CoA transferase [bacterium]